MYIINKQSHDLVACSLGLLGTSIFIKDCTTPRDRKIWLAFEDFTNADLFQIPLESCDSVIIYRNVPAFPSKEIKVKRSQKSYTRKE